MASVQKNRDQFKPNLFVSQTGDMLSSDSGLILVKELMNVLGFTRQIKDYIVFQDSCAY